jgi:N-acetylneuraminic acid mutarotase
VFTVEHAFSSKLAFTPQGRIFLIGGSKTKDANEVLNDTIELAQDANGSRQALARSPMEQGRTGFAAVVDNEGERIYVAGGTVGKHKPTAKAEYYDVSTNKWIPLAALNEAKFSQSMCLFNEELLFSFGGFDASQKPSTQIERLNVKMQNSKWNKLIITLPHPLSNMGCFQLNLKQILVFGGWKNENTRETFILQQDAIAKHRIIKQGEKEGPRNNLETADIFLFNGAHKIDTVSNTILFCGQMAIHQFDDSNRTFRTVRNL